MQMSTGTRLTTAIHRRLLSRFFLREGERLYTGYSEAAALKCDIVGKEDNYKYLVTLSSHRFRERFAFSVFFLSCKSVCGQFTTRSSTFHSYSATPCEYDNVEVKEQSVMCHAS